jgi:hypothetical protein
MTPLSPPMNQGGTKNNPAPHESGEGLGGVLGMFARGLIICLEPIRKVLSL